MSMWDKVDRSEFNDYKREVWERHEASVARLAELERSIAEKTPDLVEELRSILEKARSDQASIRKVVDETEELFSVLSQEKAAVSTALQPLKEELAQTTATNASLKERVEEVQKARGELNASKAKAEAIVNDVAKALQSAEGLLAQAEHVPGHIEAAAKLLATCEQLRDNVQGIADHSIQRKTVIDEVHYEIFGQELKSSTGATERIEGLRDKLRRSFEQADGTLSALKDRAMSDVAGVTDQLKALMPGAMAAGLSAAYEAKANSEIAAQQRLEKHFMIAIAGLATISLIPFAVDVYLLAQGIGLIDVIKQTPVLQIIPLYFPVLWFAYSTSKKVNLSKRLIEEYTHKAVLGKTFSGLSNQIDSLPKDHEVTEELRLRLLYNVLQVSAENPGKLITDYSKADHPVMEALENSSRLSGSIDAIQRIPGFTRLAEWLTARQTRLADASAKKVAEGLDAAESLIKAK